jgi:hypothetical protein
VSETGVVKFACEHVATALPPFAELEVLNECRAELRARGWLGVDANGIGYGNVSMRAGVTSSFFISGSGTGGLPMLTLRDCAKVTAWDFDRNWLRCEGQTIASAESLTHAAIYALDTTIGIVMHGHDQRVWRTLLDRGAATPRDVPYGTPEMAREVQRLLTANAAERLDIFAMGGHVDGFILYGHDLASAVAVLRTV